MKASPLSLFRVDKRKIKEGDFILPNNEYFSHLAVDRERVEKSLIRANPNPNIKRENVLFLFDDIKNALIYWQKIGISANLYEVVLEGEPVLHKADMNYLDVLLLIEQKLKDEKLLDKFSEKYWECGFGLFSPCYEILVKKAKVKNVIVEGSSELANKIMRDINKNIYIQNTDFYKDYFASKA